MIKIMCEHCGAGMELPDMFLGQVVKCVHCWDEVKVVGGQYGVTMSVAWMERVDSGERPELLLAGQPKSVHEWSENEDVLCETVVKLKEDREDGSGETGMWDVRELEARRQLHAARLAEMRQQVMGEVGTEKGQGETGESGQRVVNVQAVEGEDWISDVGELSEEEIAAIREQEGVGEQEGVVERMREKRDEEKGKGVPLNEQMKKRTWWDEWLKKRKERQQLGMWPLMGGLSVGVLAAVGWAVYASMTGHVAGVVIVAISVLVAGVMWAMSQESSNDLGVTAVVVVVLSMLAGKASVGVLGVESTVDRILQGVVEGGVTEMQVESAVLMQMVNEGQMKLEEYEQLDNLEEGAGLEGSISDELYSKIRETAAGLDEAGRLEVVKEHWVRSEATGRVGHGYWSDVMQVIGVWDFVWLLLAVGCAYVIAGLGCGGVLARTA
ncbi:hypothetical protein JD969_02555 [Planctomycetota bacterium]|nr:hypothetical protein JD969_02555 [Planctomycetota bacterium]